MDDIREEVMETEEGEIEEGGAKELMDALLNTYAYLQENGMQRLFLLIVVDSLGLLCESGHFGKEGVYIKNRVIGRFRKIVKDQLEISGRKR